MGLKINKNLILIFLILLQSCSGGRIGNFLESSFKNNEGTNLKDNNETLKNKKNIKFEENLDKNNNSEETKIKEYTNTSTNNENNKSEENADKNNTSEEKEIKNDIMNNNKNINSEEKTKDNKKIITDNKKKKKQLESYKIIFILKDVDPKDPIQDLRTILRNSDVNFEIEKIERFFDSKNKSIKKN